MKVEGSCHCGQVTFDAEIDPGAVRICHCTDCQTLTGSAFRVSVHTAAAHFALRTGSPRRAELKPTGQVWYRSALPWVADLGDIPRTQTQ
jgi:hypothetical protein